LSVQTGYVDANIIIGLSKRDYGKAKQDALAKLYARHLSGGLNLWTSPVSKEELQEYAPGWSQDERALYESFKRLPTAEQVVVPSPIVVGSAVSRRGGGVTIISPRSLPDALLTTLRALLSERDARHVFQAAKSGSDYFITFDDKTILRHALTLEKLVAPLRFTSPIQLERTLNSKEASKASKAARS
jgi:hypothetical protein